MSDPAPPSEATRRAPLSLGRRIGAAIGILVALYSGGCSLLGLIDGRDALAEVVVFGGIPLAAGLLIAWTALNRPPNYAIPPRLNYPRSIAAVAGVMIMIPSGAVLLATGASLLYGDEGPYAEVGLALGYPFLLGLTVWWLAIRVGR
ncbi:MAG: hypothetical protein WD036_10355 [Bauldia sp.]